MSDKIKAEDHAVESMLNGVQQYQEWYNKLHLLNQKAFEVTKKIMTGSTIDCDEFFNTCTYLCREFAAFLINGHPEEGMHMKEISSDTFPFLNDQNPIIFLSKDFLTYHIQIYNLYLSLYKQSKQSLIESFCQSFSKMMAASKEWMSIPKLSHQGVI